MIFAVVLSAFFLTLMGIFCLKKFQFYGLLTALIYTVLSIELITDIDGLTLCALGALCLLSLPTINLKLYDAVGYLVITCVCVFWLNTQEFIDGSAYTLMLVALGVALTSNLLFDKQKRQTLCALVLLTSFVICYTSKVYFSAVDIATAFLIGAIFTQNFQYTQSAFEISPLRLK